MKTFIIVFVLAIIFAIFVVKAFTKKIKTLSLSQKKHTKKILS
jgi:archaellum component FlaG (FlaF/FlaG flagellin family)